MATPAIQAWAKAIRASASNHLVTRATPKTGPSVVVAGVAVVVAPPEVAPEMDPKTARVEAVKRPEVVVRPEATPAAGPRTLTLRKRIRTLQTSVKIHIIRTVASATR
jgi:hypothetical protein